MKNKSLVFFFLLIGCTLLAPAQSKPKFSYAAQKQLIPVELGRVYLGMPFRDFARRLDLTESEADAEFGWLGVKIPFNRGNVTSLYFKIHGLSEQENAALMRIDKIVEKTESGEYEREIKRVDAAKIPATGFVYEINLTFKKDFDFKTYLVKMYGAPKDAHKKGAPGHFYDSQWFKKTADGLTWMIRAFHEGDDRTLKLIGVIDGTEWDSGVEN